MARNLAAIGVSIAWIQFIFIIGRLPIRGGSFSVMFYSIIKNIMAYLIAMFFLVIGFGLAFMITCQCLGDNPFESRFFIFK